MLTFLYGTAALVLIWLLLCAWLWVFQEKLIFYPRGLNSESEQISSYTIDAKAEDGTTIAGWLLPEPESDTPSGKAILFFGGNAMEISTSLIEHQQNLQVTAAGFNYRGYGQSEGEPSQESLRADALQAFDTAVEKSKITPSNWIIIGTSLGSYMAAYVASNREVGGAILVTPYDSITAIAAKRYPLFPVRKMIRHPFETTELTSQINSPVLIVRAETDRTVPSWSTDMLVASWQGDAPLEQVTIADSSHNDITYQASYWQAQRRFISSL